LIAVEDFDIISFKTSNTIKNTIISNSLAVTVNIIYLYEIGPHPIHCAKLHPFRLRRKTRGHSCNVNLDNLNQIVAIKNLHIWKHVKTGNASLQKQHSYQTVCHKP